MDIHTHVVTSIAVLVGMILLAMYLRHRGMFSEKHGPIFSRLVMQVTLPALIFSSLARTELDWSQAYLSLIMFGAEIGCLLLAWLCGRILRLASAQLGVFMLVAGFGSSSLLGYALISQIFSGNTQALTEAVIISELGVAPALFTIGVMLAIYYGSAEVDLRGRLKAASRFFVSPIFFSAIAGLLWSSLHIPTDSLIIVTLLDGFQVVGQANTFMVALTVGVLLHFQGLRAILSMALIVGLIKLIVKPVILWLPSLGMSLLEWQTQVLILEGAMPSAMLTVVLAQNYGCDAKLASKLVFATTVASSLTVLIMFWILT